MRLDTLRVRGVLAFADEVSLDLQGLPSGLIAVRGPNGSGKTTLVDGALGALYRQFPSRGDKELVDYAHDRQAFLEATFTVEGRGVYRARVNLDAVRRQSEAVLELTAPDGSVLLLNDGKVSSFDLKVAQTFPPLAVVLASAFAAQNLRGSFITLDRKGRKELFAQLLGLAHYEALAQAARQRAAALTREVESQGPLVDELRRTAGPDAEAALGERASHLQVVADAMDHTRRTLARARAEAQAAREAVVVEATRYTDAQTEHDRLVAERAAVDRHGTQTATDLAAERARVEQQADESRRRLEAEDLATGQEHATTLLRLAARLAAEREDLDARIANNERLLTEAPRIQEAQARLVATETDLATAREVLAAAVNTARALVPTRSDLQTHLARLDGVARDRDRATKDAALLTTVPCQGTGPYAGCQFLTRAREAAAQVPHLDTELATRAGIERTLRETDAQVATADTEATTAQATIRRLEATVTDLKAATKHADQIALAEGRIADYQAQLARLDERAAEERQAADARLLQRSRDTSQAIERLHNQTAETLRAIDSRLAAWLEALTAELAALDGEMARLSQILTETAEAHEKLAVLDAEIREHEQAWTQAEVEQARVDAALETLARDRDTLTHQRTRIAQIEQALSDAKRELAEWELLGRIFARDGLPTLEISAAGPQVSEHTNHLLESCFGPRFTVDLVTQEAKLDGKGLKEVFELKVFDGERGGEPRDLTDLSGGEQVLVDEALKNALAIYVNEHSAMPLRTCWRDETTGPLDGENIGRYVAMLRRLQEVAGFEHILFVTHSVDAAAMADAQIVLGNGGVHVVLPPYPEATEEAEDRRAA